MAVHLWDHKITYVPVPKIACTSLKGFFFEVENGFPWRAYRVNGQARHIHNAGAGGAGWKSHYPFQDLPHPKIADHERIAVVRDPVDRLLSAYTNRVIDKGELNAFGRPSIAEFIDGLPHYRARSLSIWHHTRPMVDFLGRDPSYYTRLYRMDQLGELVAFIRERTGSSAELPHGQRSSTKVTRADLTAEQIRRAERFFEEDYAVFGAVLEACRAAA